MGTGDAPARGNSVHLRQVATDLHELPRPGIADVLGIVLSDEQREALLVLLSDSPDRPADVWRQLRSQPAFQEQAGRLRFAVQLGLLTGNNVPLIRRILQDPGLTSAEDLVRLDGASWAGLIAEAAGGDGLIADAVGGAGPVPAEVRGRTAAERIRNYASGLADAVWAALPSQAAAHLLAADTSLVTDDNAREAVIRFLANCPDFDLRTSRVSRYLTQHADWAFAGLEAGDQARATGQLKRIQRAFQLAPGAGTAAVLLRRGLDSAHKIANMPRRSFLDQHGGALGGAGPAAALIAPPPLGSEMDGSVVVPLTAASLPADGCGSAAAPRSSGGTGAWTGLADGLDHHPDRS